MNVGRNIQHISMVVHVFFITLSFTPFLVTPFPTHTILELHVLHMFADDRVRLGYSFAVALVCATLESTNHAAKSVLSGSCSFLIVLFQQYILLLTKLNKSAMIFLFSLFREQILTFLVGGTLYRACFKTFSNVKFMFFHQCLYYNGTMEKNWCFNWQLLFCVASLLLQSVPLKFLKTFSFHGKS